MKKIILSAILFFAGLGFVNAQKAPEKTSAKTVQTTDKTAKPAQSTEVKKKSTGLKKNGTPDMRLKENKKAAKKTAVAGPTKKDGTADMRYKANKKK